MGRKKKVVDSTTDSYIKELAKNPKRRGKNNPKGSIALTPDLFIATDGLQWILREVNEKQPLGYKNLLYASSFQNILKVAVNRMIAVPMEVQELSKKLDDIYELIKLRVPVDFNAWEHFHREEDYVCE